LYSSSASQNSNLTPDTVHAVHSGSLIADPVSDHSRVLVRQTATGFEKQSQKLPDFSRLVHLVLLLLGPPFMDVKVSGHLGLSFVCLLLSSSMLSTSLSLSGLWKPILLTTLRWLPSLTQLQATTKSFNLQKVSLN